MPLVSSGRFAAATSVLALLVAMGGTGYATVKIKGNQIAKNAVTSKTVKNDSLTGTDIKESTLGTVPSAAKATSAGNATTVGGYSLTKVYYRGNNNTPTVVFNAGGLVLTANCDAGNLSLVAATTKVDSSMYSQLIDVEGNTVYGDDSESGNLDPGSTLNVLSGPPTQGELDPALLTFEYDAPDHTIVTGTLSTDKNPDGANQCGVTGTITQG